MKKLFLLMLGAALVAGPALAQEGVGISVAKVDVNKLRAAIAKSDAEIADAKKGAKSATWIKRGDILVDADAKPVNGLYMGMPEDMLKLTFGDAAPEDVSIEGVPYVVYDYENFKAYVAEGMVVFYVAKTVADPAALDKAYEAYAKAYEMDGKTAKKVATGMENIHTKSLENANAAYSLSEYKGAAENFLRAYTASAHPALNKIDTLALYYAGMSDILGGEYNKGLELIDKALALGHESEGETYRMKFLALYSLDRKSEALEVLEFGLSKYPTNEDLIDMMMRYYSENDGDPTSMIPLVQAAIEKNPTNALLYRGLARVYDKLEQNDNAIAAIRKAVELAPEDFLTNYWEGLFIVKKGDAMQVELDKMVITNRAQYQEALAKVNAAFAEALPPLERAYAIDPSETATIELLKNLTFRLRDDPEMNAKYEKYNALLEQGQ